MPDAVLLRTVRECEKELKKAGRGTWRSRQQVKVVAVHNIVGTLIGEGKGNTARGQTIASFCRNRVADNSPASAIKQTGGYMSCPRACSISLA